MSGFSLKLLAASAIVSAPLFVGSALAQPAGGEDLLQMEKNAANVVMPTMTYDNQRFSTLDRSPRSNVGKLQVAWTFSTGVLRGHEGAPLVIGDVMYVAHAVPEHGLRARPQPRRHASCGNTSRSRIRTSSR